MDLNTSALAFYLQTLYMDLNTFCFSFQFDYPIYQPFLLYGPNARKPVFAVSDQERLKPAQLRRLARLLKFCMEQVSLLFIPDSE